MKLYIIKDKKHSKVYYRFLKPLNSENHLQWTAVKERAALFLDRSAAQDVCDDLWMAGEKDFIVAEFDGE